MIKKNLKQHIQFNKVKLGIIIKIAKFYTRLKQGFVIVRCRFSLYNSRRLKKEIVIFPRTVRFIGIFRILYFLGIIGKLRSTTTYFILIIISVSMQTVLHLVSYVIKSLSLIFRSFGLFKINQNKVHANSSVKYLFSDLTYVYLHSIQLSLT